MDTSADDLLRQNLIHWVLQFLKDENLTDVAHAYEQATGCYFDQKHFEVTVLQGKFEEAEAYLAGFTPIHDNMTSARIYFELRKQNFLEALTRRDRARALNILMKDLKDFSSYNPYLFAHATKLVVIDNFRAYGSLGLYGEARIERMHMMTVVRTLVRENPAFVGKLEVPGPNDPNLFRIVKRGLAEIRKYPTRGV